jgi:outer membrane protein OmpA-like peptidoglycan-associated protein/Tfp pilus assembly protein PilF
MTSLNIKTILLAAGLALGTVAAAFAQSQDPSISEKARQWYDQAGTLITSRKFDQAAAVLLRAVDKEPEYAEAHFRLANVYELIAQVERTPEYRQKIREHYQKSVQLKPGYPPFMAAYAILGTASIGDGDYENARTYFEQFLALKPVKAAQVKEAQRMIANCEFALKAKQDPLPFQAVPMSPSVNRFVLQYFPVLTADQQTVIFTARETADLKSDEDLYVSTKKAEDWSEPEILSDRINTAANEGTCTISADGRTLVFTSCEGRQNFGSCDLFVSYKVGDEWTEPVNLGNKINSAAWESQPSLAADGRTLYFVSDRRGSYGRRDLWKSQLGEDGYWGVPENMGPNVNTTEDDLSPFIHANGRTLYFSSKGHIGMGGYDLFATEYQNGQWTFPKNLGYPLNNHDDQVSLFVTADGKKGYYAHEEKDGRRYLSSKLYEFNIPEQIAVKERSDYLKGRVFDAKTKKPLGSKIEIYNVKSGTREALISSDRLSGDYLAVLTEGTEYGLYVNKEGYLFKSLYFNYEAGQHEPVVMDIYLQPLEAGSKDVLKNLFFATGEWELENKSKVELDKLIELLGQNRNLKLEISGHTDDVGKDDANLELSRKRAKSVYDYLLKAGIEARRLTFAGYGETQFSVPNTSDKNRELNRRIEFKVL